ncbi:MAG: hypothetical protein HQL76_17220 [Magnetococcales bacterium]|nr:hypothetical protein [Magnetococcales bacterium]
MPSIFDPTFGAGDGEEDPTEEPPVVEGEDGDGGVPSIFDPTFGAGDDSGAETPSLEVSDASGVEDQAIPLSVAAALNDLDGSESLLIRIDGVPGAAYLSSGLNIGNGTWLLTAEDLVGLTVTPPADSDADFQLSVTATATESADGSERSVSGIMNVMVAADADPPVLELQDALGLEDGAIPLSIQAGVSDLDGSETLSLVLLENVPEGAVLSAGIDRGDGRWSLTLADLEGLSITPPVDSAQDFTLTVRAVSQDGADSAMTLGTIAVSVAPDADPPVLTLTPASGMEDSAILLDVTISLNDRDGSESIQGDLVITGVPEGAILNVGSAGPDHTWVIPGAYLVPLETNAQGTAVSWNVPGLTVTPPENGGEDFRLGIRVTVGDGTDRTTVESGLDVAVTSVADAAEIVAATVEGIEDTAIPLDLSFALQDQDGSERLSGNVILTGIPEGATLSVGMAGPGHTWVIPEESLAVTAHNAAGTPVAWEVPGLTITPPVNNDADFSIGIRLVTMEGDQARVTDGQLDVAIHPEADAVTFSIPEAIPVEDASDSGRDHGDFSPGRPFDGWWPRRGPAHDDDSRHGGHRGDDDSRHGERWLGGSRHDDSRHGGARDDDSRHGGHRGDDSRHGEGRFGGSRHDDSRHWGHRDDDSRHGGSHHDDHDETRLVPLAFQINLQDTDGSESLAGSIVVTGVPEGATLNLGERGADGDTWIIGPEHLVAVAFNAAGDPVSWTVPELGIVPPANAEPGFVLGLQVTSQDGDSTRVTEGSLTVAWEERDRGEGSHHGRGWGWDRSHGGNDRDRPWGWDRSHGGSDHDRHGVWDRLHEVPWRGFPFGRDGARGGAEETVVGTGEDVLTLHVARGGFGNDGAFNLVVDGETVGRFTADMAHWRDHDRWETITIDNLNLSSTEPHEIRVEPVHARSHVLVDSIEINGVVHEAEIDGQLDRGMMDGDFARIHHGGALVFALPAVETASEALPPDPVDAIVTGSAEHDVLTSGAGDDVLIGLEGDDLIGGGAGDDRMEGGDGNDLFIIGHGGGSDRIDGGAEAGWVDALHLEDVTGGPAHAGNPEGNWTLESPSDYTIDELNREIRFDGGNASGTITLEDGTLIEFDNLEMIGW